MIRSELGADGVRLITLDRPEVLNAFNGEQFDRLAERFVEAEADDATRVVVLTGAGRAFSSGADLSGNRTGNTPKYGFEGCVDILIEFTKPWYVAANGLGVGFGATVLGLADMAYMAESARLRCPFSALGLTAEGASTYTFPRLMGPANAARMLLGAEWWSAAECKAAGLAMDVLPDEGFLEAVMAKASALAAFPVSSLRETKALLMAPHIAAMKQANHDENRGLGRLSGGPANIEAVTAFREKRQPNFAGL